MPGSIWLFLVLLAVVLIASRLFKTDREAVRETRPSVAFPGANVRLDMPPGFTVALDFEGFGLPESRASVLVMPLPGPFSQVEAGFTDDALRTQGMQLLLKQSCRQGTLPGLLLQAAQTAGGTEWEKWIVAFGDDDEVHLVTATYPREEAERFSALLKETVLSARREEDRTASAPSSSPAAPAGGMAVLTPFQVDSGTDLTLAREIGKMLAFTRDGSFPIQSPTEPLFVVAPSLGAVTVLDRNQFARSRVQQTEQVRGVTITAQSPLRVDEMDGVEIVARASDVNTGTPLTVYQAVLFDDAGYYLMQGLVGLDDSGIYLPIFKTVARTFRRTVRR